MLTFEQYISLLLSAATGYDAQFAATNKSGRRAVYFHNVIDQNPDPEQYDHDYYYDIDSR
jgi:hypothetical protein